MEMKDGLMHLHSDTLCSLSLLYMSRDKQTPQRIPEPLLLFFTDIWYIWVNQMSSWASTDVAVGLVGFLSAVIGVFLSFVILH